MCADSVHGHADRQDLISSCMVRQTNKHRLFWEVQSDSNEKSSVNQCFSFKIPLSQLASCFRQQLKEMV